MVDDLLDVLQTTPTVPYYIITNFFLTGALFENKVSVEDLPSKGEDIVATFDFVKGKLQCTNLKLISRDDLAYIDIKVIDDLYAVAKGLIFNKNE